MKLGIDSGLIDGKYEIVKRLASGGMGDVYQVRHQHLKDLRVIKVLRSDLAANEEVAQRFQQEALVATQIKHPHVAILYDYSKLPDGHFYMVWEYIDGEDLASYLESRGVVEPRLAVDFTVQALRGLDAIHAAGMIHRDVSPDNLMLTEDRKGRAVVKIIDLGLVKDLRDGGTELTAAGDFLGKFRYCSPEQAGYLKDEPLDHRSDLYSMALVLYEMLSGLPPFESDSGHGYVLKRLSEEPVPLEERNPTVRVPPALASIVMRGLARDRSARFADASAFIAALEHVGARLVDTSTQELDLATVERVRAQIEAKKREGEKSRAEKRRRLDRSAAAPAATPGSRGDLSRKDKLDLLARIERASTRSVETSKTVSRVEMALERGEVDEARRAFEQLKRRRVPPRDLPRLERRLLAAEAEIDRSRNIRRTEEMLERYLEQRQETAAKLALETLLELQPHHPRRDDFQAWVGLLGDEVAQQRRAEAAAGKVREHLQAGDLRAAHSALAELERLDLSRELFERSAAAVRERETGAAVSRRFEEARERLVEHLEAGRLEEAEVVVEEMAGLGAARVTLDGYRDRIARQRTRRRRETAVTTLEKRFANAIAERNWLAARGVASELGAVAPGSDRPREMLAELAELESAEGRSQSLAEGLRTFEDCLERGAIDQARLALELLERMSPGAAEVLEAGARLARARRE